MDMEDGEPTEGVSISEEKNVEKVVVLHAGEIASEGNSQIPYCYVSPIPFFCSVFYCFLVYLPLLHLARCRHLDT